MSALREALKAVARCEELGYVQCFDARPVGGEWLQGFKGEPTPGQAVGESGAADSSRWRPVRWFAGVAVQERIWQAAIGDSAPVRAWVVKGKCGRVVVARLSNGIEVAIAEYHVGGRPAGN